ncbi:MAG: SGNH/GDSL hydrolase family protein [Planctomycetes bacterium]|nr:SGNH/GDSL hydrolase family protein [Planctomycetota bacterium]
MTRIAAFSSRLSPPRGILVAASVVIASIWLGQTTASAQPDATPDADARRKAKMSPEELAWEKVLEENLGSFYLPIYKKQKLQGRETAWDYVEDDPKLPRVLLIGDSVSRGYTLAVRHALAGKVNLHRAPANCGSTAAGIKKLDVWLGDGRWDVIHFNFGLHDLHTKPADYEERLEQIVSRLEKTGAKLIWAQTTPVPEVPEKKWNPSDPIRLNELAGREMKRRHVAVNDLHAWIQPTLSEHQNPKDIHFNAAGYERLAQGVAQAILAALASGKKR